MPKLFRLRFPALLLLIPLFFACSNPDQKIETNPAFGEYIFAYTSGIISVNDPIRIKLAQPYSGKFSTDESLPTNLLTFEPEIDGDMMWQNNSTLKFIPKKPLKGGQNYLAKLRVKTLIPKVKDGMENFNFQFQTIEQDMSVYVDGLETPNTEDFSRMVLRGKIHTADDGDLETIKKAIQASQNEKELPMEIVGENEHTFAFTIQDIVRGETRSKVKISWELPTSQGKVMGDKETEIPSLSDFEVTNVQVIRSPEQVVKVHFSDPISDTNIEGIATVEGVNDLKFHVSGNTLSIYPEKKINGQKLLRIDGTITNISGRQMKEAYTETILFEVAKPEVKILGNKAVLPSQIDGVLFPFEAISLHSVDVYITKIFTDNILQYLQTSNFGESYDMDRVGRNIYRKHLNLRESSGADLNKWNRYYVDLSDVIKADPGALYEVEIRFKQKDALYDCDDKAGINDDNLTHNSGGWTSDGTYFVDDYWDDYQYDWDEQENPCNAAYYYRSRTSASKVVMATNLGLTAKMGSDKQLLIAVNNLKTTQPVSAANVKVYDFQQQLIAESHTDNDGFAIIECIREPFAVMASTTDGRTYLKVGQGNELSLSKFDVAGSYVQEGVKGYIYGERGVWRPGDSLYLNFVLEDLNKSLPENHPVEMELYNPLGQIVKRIVKTMSVNGFYDLRTATDVDAPTGDYRMTVSVGNRQFSKNLKIETVKPNRLKIGFEFDKPEPGAAKLSGKLTAAWLTGATASGLKASVDMTLQPTNTTFKGYESYHFDNNIREGFQSEETRVFENKLNADGFANLNIDMSDKTKDAPGILKASFSTKVYEPGGNFSVDYNSVDFAPYKSFVGIRLPESKMWGNALEVDKTQHIDLVALDSDGNLTNEKELKIKVYRIDNYWWYDRYNGTKYNYLNSTHYQEEKNETVPLKNGKGIYDITIPKGQWGRYLIHVEDPVSGHSSALFVYFDWPYWMRANKSDSEASTILGFSSDKKTYNVGDSVKLTFPSPENGRALVSIENGSKILDKFWVQTKKGETKVAFMTTAEMAPNVYAHISLLQPFTQTINDRPMRMYGVIPIPVENPESRLAPIITAPEVFRPESKAKITVKEKNGKKMTYTLAVVDEGLLSLTRFHTPNPWDNFFAREALGVNTWDMYDMIVGAFTDGMGSILSIGGDQEAVNPAKQKAMRFKPMVRYIGPFTLEASKTDTHTISIPNYIGAVRVMVVAGYEHAYGSAEKEIPVRSPLMVLGTMPRVVGPGEELSLPVNVFAMEEHVKDVSIAVSTNELFKLKGDITQNMRFDKTGDKVAYFDLETTKETGVGRVTIVARSGNELSKYKIEIDVRTPNPMYTEVRDTVILAGETWNPKFKYFGIDGTNKGVVELSKMPALNLQKRLDYLIQYPHGCLEQITSGGFPQLYLNQMIDLSSDQSILIEENVKSVLRNYRNFQLPSGGFSYWPGSSAESDWGTSYGGEFMLEAEKLGYALPAGLKAEWIRYQKAAARRWNSNTNRTKDYEERMQAYRLYTLARAGQADFGSMNVLKSRKQMSLSARWILALAYAEAGQPEVASNLVESRVRDIPAYTELSYTYGSGLRDEAFVLRTLLALNKQTDAAQLAKKIATKMGSNAWYSTQTVAYSLGALAKYMGQDHDDGLKASITSDGDNQKIETAKDLIQQDLLPKGEKGNVQITNNSEQPLYARLLLSGKPLQGMENRVASNLRMKVKFMDNNLEPISVDKLKMGTDFIAEVEIINPGTRGYLRNMALTQIFPSGWEILNPRMEAGNQTNKFQPDYQDIRDDRVLSYFNMASGANIMFRIRLNASYKGRFYMPAITCSAMYDETITAVEPGKWVEVVP